MVKTQKPGNGKEVFVRRILQIVLGVSREDIASDDFWDIFDNKQVDKYLSYICEKPLYRDVLQMDQAAPAHQDVLWNIPKCSLHTDMDYHL